MKVIGLKINGMDNPVGFAYDRVLCSWKVTECTGKTQKNVCIKVSETADFSNVLYEISGAEPDSAETELKMDLKPCTTYYWNVAVTADNDDQAISKTATFETGKMDEDWIGKWIAPAKEDTFHPVFRKVFDVKKKVSKARLYICGLGWYEAYLNGVKAGNDYLAPFLNDYMECCQYQTYDVTPVAGGSNVLEVMLGKGWYMGAFGLQNKANLFGDRMQMIAELHVTYDDGTKTIIGTDESWQYQGSDVEDSGIYLGEILNRQLWKDKENPWKIPEIVEAPGKLVERYSIPVIVKEELKPIEIIHTPAGETVVDMGQNHAGYMEFCADFPAGTKVTFECAEILQNGNFYHDNYRSAQSVFVYVSDGRKEMVRPHFTYFGYRYLKVTGWPGELEKDDITAKVVYSDMERIGFIETSNEKINRVYQNCLWSQKSNFIDLPTDCPQRDERLGWTGDAQVFAPTASYNMDTRAFFNKFFKDLRSEQKRMNGGIPNYIPSLGDMGVSSVWGDVGTFVPNQVYETFGTLKAMESHYPMMRDWVEYMYRVDESKGNKRLFLNGFQFGDWLALDGITESSFKGSTDDDYIGTVYYYQSAKLTAKMAERLGYDDDALKYSKLADEIRQAIFNEYFTPSGRLAMDTQASYIIALKFGLYIDKEKLIAQFKDRLKKDCYQIKCGFVGAPLLCMTLCENGMTDLAYHFLFNERFPGWLYQVNLGATTIWERWNSVFPDGSMSPTGMNSLNHYAYGSVVEFFYAYVAGIRAAAPGFRKAIIAPEPRMKFRYFNCTYDSACGKYVSNWKIAEDGTFTMYVEIPFNCEAEVVLPRYNGEPISISTDAGNLLDNYEYLLHESEISTDGRMYLDAGKYKFLYKPINDFRNVYGPETRLAEVADDPEVMAILKEELPVAYGIIMSGDKENMNLCFGALGHMFFMGFVPEVVEKVSKKIYSLKRW